MSLLDFIFKRAPKPPTDPQAVMALVDDAFKRILGQEISMKSRLARTELSAGRSVKHSFYDLDQGTDEFLGVASFLIQMKMLSYRKSTTIFALVTRSVDEITYYTSYFRSHYSFTSLMNSFGIDVRWGIPDWEKIKRKAKGQSQKPPNNYHLVFVSINEFISMRPANRQYIDLAVMDANESYKIVDVDSIKEIHLY
jgi:hypothetical protein